MNNSLPLPLATREHHDPNGRIIVTNETTNEVLCGYLKTLDNYFTREKNYDRPQVDKIHPKPYKAILLTEIDPDLKAKKVDAFYNIFGICFMEKRTIAGEESWILKWTWVHPFFRNRGNFYKLWSYLEEEFGDFFIHAPASPEMSAFLKRNDQDKKHIII